MIGLMLMSGCATFSEYHQGCLDGGDALSLSLKMRGIPYRVNPNSMDQVCTYLENNRKRPEMKAK